jgi:hypothetical protein
MRISVTGGSGVLGKLVQENHRFLIFQKNGNTRTSGSEFYESWNERTAGPGFVGALERENRRFLSFTKIAKRGLPNPDFFITGAREPPVYDYFPETSRNRQFY